MPTGNHGAHGIPAILRQRRDGGGFQARGQLGDGAESLGRHVVVNHDVATGHLDTINASHEVVEGRATGEVPPLDEHGFGLQDDVSEDLKTSLAQGGSGLDDISDGVSHPESDRGLHGTVQVDEVSVDTARGQEGSEQARG